MRWAIFGRCSLILTPGTLVAISLTGPPLAWPGLRSHRSMVLGPPDIHSRIHALLRAGCAAAAPASRSSQPDREAPIAPKLASRNQSRREIVGRVISPPQRKDRRKSVVVGDGPGPATGPP